LRANDDREDDGALNVLLGSLLRLLSRGHFDRNEANWRLGAGLLLSLLGALLGRGKRRAAE
jgi:hypothetical protein